jgi:hypothetical protein
VGDGEQMKDPEYVSRFIKAVYTESTELCMTAFDEKECLQDATILINQLRAKNARLREALRWVNMSLCAYLDHAPANLKELAYYPEKAVSNAFILLEGNDEKY